jgi:hypothetical protein
MSILDKDSMTEDHWSNNPRFKKEDAIMSDTNTGGPAFPLFAATGYAGMTLRDYFAAKALQGLLAGTLKSSDTSLIARDCYAMADAVLKAREA